MRVNTLIILSIAVLACLAINATSFDDSYGKTADELFNSTGEGFAPVDSRFPATPHESREIAAANKSSVLNQEIPSHLSSAKASNPQESRDLAASESASPESNDSTEQTSTQETPQAATTGSLDLSGKWLFSLDGGRNVEVNLIQNSGVIFGTGSITEDNTTNIISASGSLAGDKLKLDLVSFGSVNLYKLSVTPEGNSASGSYTAYFASGEPVSGSVSGSKSA